MIMYPGWTKLWLEIQRDNKDKTKFSGALYCGNTAISFELNLIIPVDEMTFKEWQKPVYIRRLFFKIKVTNINGETYDLIDDSDYDFFFDNLVEYAIKLHYDIESKKLGDREPYVPMKTSNGLEKAPIINSDIFAYLIKTRQIPEIMYKKPLQIKNS